MNTAKKTKTRGSPAIRGRVHDNSTGQESPVSTTDGPTRKAKRKARPDRKTLRKRARISEDEHTSPSEEDVIGRGLKRRVRDDGEGVAKKRKEKRRRLDLDKFDMESASSSVDTESCDIKRGSKRKAADSEGEGPTKKKKRSPDLTETAKETKEDNTQKTKKTKEDTEQYLSVAARRDQFKSKYQEQGQLGKGGCGSVYAGYRKADHLPVAIKHIPKNKVFCKHMDENKKQLATEVAIMLKLRTGESRSVGTSAPVSLLDWYDLDQELILVLERPVPSEDLLSYIEVKGGSLQELEAKVILKQLVEAGIDLQNKCIFHRDIKVENILIETGSDVPRVRIIDFGLSCFVKKRSLYRVFYGTSGYVPPEWYSQNTYRAGPTTVWQMGVVLFETVHRKTVFNTNKYLKNKQRINRRLSKNCKDFLERCLTKDPQQRITLEQLQHHPWLR